MVMIAPQQGQVAPVRDMVPAPHAPVVLPALRSVPAVLRHIGLHAEDHTRPARLRLHRQKHTLVVLLTQPARLEQGQRGPALLAGDGARP